jgi:hypothetical protein
MLVEQGVQSTTGVLLFWIELQYDHHEDSPFPRSLLWLWLSRRSTTEVSGLLGNILLFSYVQREWDAYVSRVV